jgi:hypothetical protein
MPHPSLETIAGRLSEQAAATFLADHPEAFILSVEEAASVGRLVAQTCTMDAT